MFSTRSARLAATLLLALLLGWVARAYRLREAAASTPVALPSPAALETPQKSAKNSFPDE